MKIKLEMRFPGLGLLAMKLALAGCLATAANGAGIFTSTGSLITARADHTATLLANGQVLVAGGQDVNGFTLVEAELYDPATGYWSPTGSLYDEPVQSTATLAPATGTWTPTGSLATARFHHTATLLANGQVLVAGGYDFYYGFLADAELYDPDIGVWMYHLPPV